MLKTKLLLLFIIITILLSLTAQVFAKPVEAFENAKEIQSIYPGFGKRPWEIKLNSDIKEHKTIIRNECKKSQKKYEEKLRRIREQKKKEKEERERQERLEAERKALLTEAKEAQDKYTKLKKEELSDNVKDGHWKSIGVKRITHYCPACNTPTNSYSSSSGQKLYEGAIACSWLPIGTIVKINGKIYKNIDRCGTSAIDIFRDTPGSCSCSSAGSYSAKVYVLKK